MLFSRILAIILRQFYLMRSSLTRILPLFIWVAIDMVLWGFISRYLITIVPRGLNFITALLGAVLLWDFFSRVMFGITTAFFEDVWSRNFLNLFASPISVAEYVSGLVIVSVMTSAIGLLVMAVMAVSIFGLDFSGLGALVVVLLFSLFLFGIALGVLSSAIVLRFGPAAEWFIWPIPAMLSPFVGVFYPIATLPPWMQHIAYVLPPTYVFEGLRAVLSGAALPATSLLSSICLSGIYIVLACRCFTAVFNRGLRSGLIARYSAENTG